MLGRVGMLLEVDFRRLWVGETISQFGSQVSVLAIPHIATVVLPQTSAFEGGRVCISARSAILPQ